MKRRNQPSPWKRFLWAAHTFLGDALGLVALAFFVSLLIGLGFAVKACEAHYAYGDWKCAMKHCVEIKESKQ